MCRSSLCTCGQFLMGCSFFSKKLNKRADGQQDPSGCLTSHQPSSPVNVFPLYRQMLTAGPARQVFDFPCLLWLFLSFGNPDLGVLFLFSKCLCLSDGKQLRHLCIWRSEHWQDILQVHVVNCGHPYSTQVVKLYAFLFLDRQTDTHTHTK